jgi:hypothetical protein
MQSGEGLSAAPCLRQVQCEPQGEVWAAEMVIGPPPLEMGHEFARELGGGPGAAPSARRPRRGAR